jgi:hypothetical protein
MTNLVGQGRPDFGGKWTFVRGQTIRGDEVQSTGEFGETFIATQSPAGLTVDWSFRRPGRGTAQTEVEQKVHSTFVFDGTPSNVADIYSSGSISRVTDTSAWDGQKLVITTTWQGNRPATVSRKRTIWLDSDGVLIVETNAPAPDGRSSLTLQSRYRRGARPPY